MSSFAHVSQTCGSRFPPTHASAPPVPYRTPSPSSRIYLKDLKDIRVWSLLFRQLHLVHSFRESATKSANAQFSRSVLKISLSWQKQTMVRELSQYREKTLMSAIIDKDIPLVEEMMKYSISSTREMNRYMDCAMMQCYSVYKSNSEPSALQKILNTKKDKSFYIFQELLSQYSKKNGHLNSHDELGDTLLHRAVEYPGSLRLVRLLLISGAYVNPTNIQTGRTPLHHLLRRGAQAEKVHSCNNLNDGLDASDLINCLKVLIEQDSNVDVKDHAGHTTLFGPVLQPRHFKNHAS